MLNVITLICGIVVIVCGIIMLVANNETNAINTLVKKTGEQPAPEQVEALVKKLKRTGLVYIGIGVVLVIFWVTSGL